MNQSLIQSLSMLMGFFMLAALVILWWRLGRNPWLLGAWIAELVGILCRLAFMVMPSELSQYPSFMGAWQLAHAVMALCLFSFAIMLPPNRQPPDSPP